MGTCFENWNCEEFKGYNYGYTDISDMEEFEFKPSNRTRKVTITEITDESIMDDNEIDFDLNAEELHKSFETVIEDWKIKMEVIIGKKISYFIFQSLRFYVKSIFRISKVENCLFYFRGSEFC